MKRISRPSIENLGKVTSGGGAPPESTGDRGAPESTGMTNSRRIPTGALPKASQRPSGEKAGREAPPEPLDSACRTFRPAPAAPS